MVRKNKKYKWLTEREIHLQDLRLRQRIVEMQRENERQYILNYIDWIERDDSVRITTSRGIPSTNNVL